ncbi:serine hydrolase FSH [Aspergillus welwitschiae]|uniref:Serine hydrolase FSH n=1 Tax=Aspergillus welwitschiae TaxID=1341132 RepID=A0A3F3QA75_9EURO|nr:serine hydrolase FSH [Aspergillus welwitschiae]RDH36069.1 serine hydrolase FSH [Aspergillus welwitschiae]
MKILCLHGYGTGPNILRYQLSGLMRDADPSWEFHFLSAEVECPPAPDIGSTFPPPYYCWTRSFDAGSIDAAHALIEEAIDEHGPFDGVLGFSQGAAISVSFLLEHKTAYPDEPPPFRFAIFYSPTIPCAADEAYCRSVLGTLSSADQQRLRSGKDKEIAQLPEPVRSVTESLVKVIKGAHSITRESVPFFLDRPLELIPCALHPDVVPTRISIPSLHLRGKNDVPGLDDCGLLVECLCDSNTRRPIIHSAGHDIPRSGPELKQMLSAVEWVVAKSQLPLL